MRRARLSRFDNVGVSLDGHKEGSAPTNKSRNKTGLQDDHDLEEGEIRGDPSTSNASPHFTFNFESGSSRAPMCLSQPSQLTKQTKTKVTRQHLPQRIFADQHPDPGHMRTPSHHHQHKRKHTHDHDQLTNVTLLAKDMQHTQTSPHTDPETTTPMQDNLNSLGGFLSR